MIRNPGKRAINPDGISRTRQADAMRVSELIHQAEETLELCGTDSVPAKLLPVLEEISQAVERLELLLAQEHARANVACRAMTKLAKEAAQHWGMTKDDNARMGYMLVAVSQARSAMARIQSWARGALDRYDRLPETFSPVTLAPTSCDGCKVLHRALESISSPYLDDQIRLFEKHATRKK
jgi:hypothetical protein